VTGEASRTDTYLDIDDFVTVNSNLGYRQDIGYAQLPAAEYHDGGVPDCAVTTPRAPSTGNDIPEDVIAHNIGEDEWDVRVFNGNAGLPNGTDGTSILMHTAQDNTSDNTVACGHGSATTDSSGYFDVSFAHTLTASPAAVIISPRNIHTGSTSDIPGTLIVVNGTKSTTGFQARAIAVDETAMNTKSVEYDYWAVTSSSVDTADYKHKAGQTVGTTTSGGYLTIDYSDFPAGFTPSTFQVAGAVSTGVNIVGTAVMTSKTQTSAQFRALHLDGTAMNAVSIRVEWIAAGPIGGAPRTSTTTDFHQKDSPTQNGITSNDKCGQTVSSVNYMCLRWPLGTPTYEYEYSAGFSGLGASYKTRFENGLAKWESEDIDIPDFNELVSGSSELLIDAEDIGTTNCANANVATGDFTYGDGTKYFTDDGEINWNTNATANCGAGTDAFKEMVFGHEMGHIYGMGHNQDSNSIMNSSGNGGTLDATDDIGGMRALYGYSGSIHRPDLKVSDLVNVSKGLSSGKVRVVSVGEAQKKGRAWLTPVTVQADSYVGSVPEVVWVPGRIAPDHLGQPTVFNSNENMPITEFVPGAEFVLQLSDKTGEVFEAQPVKGSKVELGQDFKAVDDIDGGVAYLVDVAKLKAEAHRVTPTTTTTP
jgi:Matrixin